MAVMNLIINHGDVLFLDTVKACMTVITRLSSRIDPNSSQLESYVSSLSTLFQHPNELISGPITKCFVTLTDRFVRKGHDLTPIISKGLVSELTKKLASVGETPSSSQSITTIVNLLLTLCRGSAKAAHVSVYTYNNQAISYNLQVILRSDLPSSIRKALKGDERCVLDVLRLINLLMTLIFDGRSHLPKTLQSMTTKHLEGFTGDATNRRVIEAIRAGNNEEFYEVLESGVDVDYMDDVGQTLLNWASAFGTVDMVDYLLENGADVNRGLKSSSLHYAACFCRTNIIKLLLQYGADPDLRDEDGHTPLDKAQERGEEWYKQCMEIFENPDYILHYSDSDSFSSSSETGELSIKNKDEKRQIIPEVAAQSGTIIAGLSKHYQYQIPIDCI
jgi:E3 ubiquitin-protein ligase HECTD1